MQSYGDDDDVHQQCNNTAYLSCILMISSIIMHGFTSVGNVMVKQWVIHFGFDDDVSLCVLILMSYLHMETSLGQLEGDHYTCPQLIN